MSIVFWILLIWTLCYLLLMFFTWEIVIETAHELKAKADIEVNNTLVLIITLAYFFIMWPQGVFTLIKLLIKERKGH